MDQDNVTVVKRFSRFLHRFIPSMKHYFYQYLFCELLSIAVLITVYCLYTKFFDIGLSTFFHPITLQEKVRSALPPDGNCMMKAGAPSGLQQDTNVKCTVTMYSAYLSFAIICGYLYLIGLLIMCIHAIYTLFQWLVKPCRK